MAIPTQKDKDQRYAPYAGGGGLAASSSSRIGAHIATNTTQTINNSDTIAITFHVAHFDDNSFWSVSSPTRITFATAGRYQINVQVSWNQPGDGHYRIQARLNGLGTDDQFLCRDFTKHVGLSSIVGVAHGFSFILNANAADYITIEVRQFSSGNQTLEGNTGIQDPACRVWIAKQ